MVEEVFDEGLCDKITMTTTTKKTPPKTTSTKATTTKKDGDSSSFRNHVFLNFICFSLILF